MHSKVEQDIEELRKKIKEISPKDLHQELLASKPPVVIDVREDVELEQGFLKQAIHCPRGQLELKIGKLVPDIETSIVFYCAAGVRSLLASGTSNHLGYKNVRSLAGGYHQWEQEGFPTVNPVSLTPSQKERYRRHLNMPEVGAKGQAKLIESKVLLVGAGGLGCPAAFYLAGAGVGTLGLVDFDKVEMSNLQRQVLHTEKSVGQYKVDSAYQTLLHYNSDVKVERYRDKLTSNNIEEIVSQYDLIIDGCDNFPTRYLVNDACVKLKKTCVHGSVYRFEGQVTIFDHHTDCPCYRCLYPEPPPPELAPSCADAGVLGVLPGIIGLLQACEAIKHLLGIGESLRGKLLAYDGLKQNFCHYQLQRDSDCSYCAPGKEFPGFIDYDHFCKLS